MSKVCIDFVALLLLCSTAFLQVTCELDKSRYSRILDITVSNSSTVPFKGYLYTISKNQSHIHVNSTDSNYQPCDIKQDTHYDNIEVTSTEDEIFVVGIQSIIEKNQYKYSIMRIDPIVCDYELASIPETIDDAEGRVFPRLVSRPTGTDVFFPNLQNCAPCRLNNVGLRSTEPIVQIPHDDTLTGYLVQMGFVNSMDAYFYVYNSFDTTTFVESAMLKLLDSDDFKVKRERNLEFPVQAVSRQKKSTVNLGVCMKERNQSIEDAHIYSKIRCDKLNDKLETTSNVRIPIESMTISSISYEFDEHDNSYVSFAEDTKLRIYIHDRDGKLVKDILLDPIDGRFEHYPDFNPEEFDAYNYWNVNGFLIGDEYCIVTEQVAKTYPTPLHQVRCVDVKQYVKH